MKMHVGCGSVYLLGWRNVDLPCANVYLAADRQDLVERYGTIDAQYYARHQDKTVEKLRQGPVEKEYVADAYGSFFFLPARDGEVTELLARHSFEHMSISEARKALQEISRVLAPGAILRLDVPDHEETMRLYKQTGDEFYIRHLLGPRRGDYGFHCLSYNRERLRALVENYGFQYQDEEMNIHIYPAFCLRWVKRV